jgi:hypothetical protein
VTLSGADMTQGSTDNVRQTGPALEAVYRFILWLIRERPAGPVWRTPGSGCYAAVAA